MTADWANNKAQGSYYESLFTTECLKRGISVSQPEGDYLPYDLITDSRFGLKKIQVKGTARKDEGSRGYRTVIKPSADFDMLAIYVDIPDIRTWYVIPKDQLGRTVRAVKVFPHNPVSRGKYEPYKAAFHLL